MDDKEKPTSLPVSFCRVNGMFLTPKADHKRRRETTSFIKNKKIIPMKKTTISLMCGAALLCACQSGPEKTTISGTLQDLSNDTLFMMNYPLNQRSEVAVDTILAQEGKFTYEVACDSVPVNLGIYAKPSGAEAEGTGVQINLLVFPGESITMTGTTKDYQVEGSPFFTAYSEAEKAWKSTEEQMMDLYTKAVQMQKDGIPADSIMRFYAPAQDYYQQITEAKKKFVSENPDNDVALYLLQDLGLDNIRELLPKISDKVKNGPLAVLYRSMDDRLAKEEARAEAKKAISEGAQAPDFTLKDINGKDLALSSLRGKYVVLDFWGSWCGWCIKGIPDMKKYYDKYKDKMEILGIDCNDTEESWKEAVKEHEMPWLHVRNEGDAANDVSVRYAIEGYPTKIVVDPEGKIAKVVVGESPAFYEYLDSLFH